MLSFLSEFNWSLIGMIVLVSIIVAYVGDIVGMKIGKRRISMFGLRPRYTSTLITVVSGVLIAAGTLIAAGSVSESVRSSLFGMKYISREMTSLTLELQTAKDELKLAELNSYTKQIDLESIDAELSKVSEDMALKVGQLEGMRKTISAMEKNRLDLVGQLEKLGKTKSDMEKSIGSLKKDSERLKAGLSEMKERAVIVSAGSLLAQTTLEAKPSKSRISSAYAKLLEDARETIRKQVSENKGLASLGNIKKFDIEISAKDKLTAQLAESKERSVLRLIADSNAVLGQKVTASVTLYSSRLVFPKGYELIKKQVPYSLKNNEAADFLYTILAKDLNRKAVASGILPNPLSGSVGEIDSIKFYEAIEEITEAKAGSEIVLSAQRDIYSEGPVFVEVSVVSH